MTDNRQKLSARLAEGLRAAFECKPAFCNIADGTHAGSITMVAEESVDNAYLVVKAGANDGGFAVAGAADKPFGVCSDEGAKGERLAVILPASAESTIMCRAATDIPAGASVYTSANGKVSAAAADGSYKVGVAVCSAVSGGLAEIDPQGFGESAWKLAACGVHEWTTATTSDSLEFSGLNSDSVVIAAVQSAGGSEKTVKAAASTSGISFTLDANGTAGSTKIAWIAISKN